MPQSKLTVGSVCLIVAAVGNRSPTGVLLKYSASKPVPLLLHFAMDGNNCDEGIFCLQIPVALHCKMQEAEFTLE